VKEEREDGVAFSAPAKPLDACTPAARREGRVAAQCCATTQAEAKAMSTDVYERVSSQIANEFERRARPRLKPWNAEYAKERITHPLRGTSRADVKGVGHAAA
jgi:predicted amidophosphoribosyltransferase